jgi:outer membrane immunogenic protein
LLPPNLTPRFLAVAADLPAYKAPPPAPVYSWTGFYIGGDVGARSAVVDPTVTAGILQVPGFPSLSRNLLTEPSCSFGISNAVGSCPGNSSLDHTAFRLGIFAGYNWQFSSQWVAGVEVDWGWANRSRSLSGEFYPGGARNFVPGNGDASFSVKTTWDASARLRLGFLLAPNVLAYATGGASWLHVEATSVCDSAFVGETCAGFPGDAATPALPGLTPAVITHSATRLGWTVGGGVEAAFWSNWLLRAEYRYADYGNWSNNDVRTCVSTVLLEFATTPSCAFGTGGIPRNFPAGTTLAASYDIHLRTHLLKFGLAYKFGVPAVASY